MTKLKLQALIVLVSSVLIFLSFYASAAPSVGFNVVIGGIPTLREDGSPLSSDDIKSFRVFKVGAEGLEALSPDIIYTGGDSAAGLILLEVSSPTGSFDLCAMTIDKLDQSSKSCGDVVSIDYSLSPPDPPGSFSGSQALTITVDINLGE